MIKEVLSMLVAVLLISYISAGIAITVVDHHVDHHVDKHHKVETASP